MLCNPPERCPAVYVLLSAVLIVSAPALVLASDPPEEKVFYRWDSESETGPNENRYTLTPYPGRTNSDPWRAVLVLNPTYRTNLPFSWQSYNLRLGDVVPMLGKLYRVVEFDVGGDSTLMLREFDSEQLPCSVRLNPKNLAIACEGSVTIIRRQFFNADRVSVIVRGIKEEGRTEVVPTAEVTVRSRGRSSATKEYASVRAGDILEASGAGLVVRNIVPPIPKHNVIGWVEFDPTPVKLDGEEKGGEEKGEEKGTQRTQLFSR